MKARFFSLLAMVLCLASCQKDVDGLDVNVGGDTATISVVLPENAITRATPAYTDSAASGLDNTDKIVRVVMHIYDEAGRVSDNRYVDYLEGDARTVNFDIRLVPNRKYTFVAWADQVDAKEDVDKYFNTSDLRNVTLATNSWTAMNEERDAFTATHTEANYTSSSDITLTLIRPFAKLRVVATDMEFLNDLAVQPTTAKVSYATKHYSAFNAVAGVAINKDNNGVEHEYTIASYGEDWENGEDMTLFTDYFFAADGQEEVNFSLEVFDQNNKLIKYNNFNTAIPVKRNHLTTIQGNILTDGNNITVTVDEEFDKPAIDEIVWDGKSVKEPGQDADGNYIIYEGSELAWVADQVNGVTRAAANTFKGKTIKLMKDINLGGNRWTPIGLSGYDNIFNGTFDGQGHTIANLVVNNNKCAGLFGGTTAGTFKNLTIDGVELITNHYAGAIVAWTESGSAIVSIDNCHVKNAKITVTPELVNGKYDNGDKAGAIVGHAYATDINRCTAENIEITAFRDVAGIAGYATKRSITNCSVKNAVITSDQIHEYDGDKDGNAGVIVGRIANPVTLEGNTTGENVVVIRKVDSTKELEYAVEDAQNGDTIYLGNGTFDMPKFTGKELSFEGIGNGATLNEPTSTHADPDYAGSEISFKNVTIDGTMYGTKPDGTPTYHGFVGGLSETYVECTIKDYFTFASDKVTVNNTEFVGQEGQYFWTGISKDVEFNNCKFYGVDRAVNVCGHIKGQEHTATFNNCEFTAQNVVKSALEIDGTNGKFTVNVNSCKANGFKVSDNSGESLFNIKGGAENVTIKIDGNTWVGKGIIKDENDNYVVNSLTTLETALESAGAAGAGNTTIVFAEDAELNMTNVEWTPIEVDGYHGADIVTIEGNGAVITGLKSALFAGGFAGGSGIVIKNLTIKDSNIVADDTQGYGAFVNCADSMDVITLINCHLENSSIITPNDGTDDSRIGGLVGWTAGYNKQNDGPVDSYITIENCSVIGCTLKGAGSIGGICGHAGANAATFTTIKNCTVTGNTFISTDSGDWRVGVVVGTANNGQCVINGITESGNTLEQTGKTAPTGEKRNYYGRFVPAGTGTLTIDGEEVIIINSAESLAAVIENAKAGDTITIAGDITLTEAVTIPAGVIFNGNGKQINGTLVAGGDITFAGHTKVTLFSAGFNGNKITIDKGACLEITGGDRSTMGYNNTFNITGTITDAKSADKANIQPSLIMPAGISITGGNGLELNIKDAYVQLGSTTSKNSAANGTFTINIENSIAEFTNQLTFAEPTGGVNPTFVMDIKDSVFTTGTKLCVAAANSTITVDNSTVTLGSNLRNSGTIELTNGSVMTGSTIQFGENGGNNGTINVDNSLLTVTASSTGNAFDGKDIGSITATNGARVSVDYYKDMTINTDATSTFTGTEVM